MRSAISLTFPLRYLNKNTVKTFVLSYYAPTRVKIVQILFPEEKKRTFSPNFSGIIFCQNMRQIAIGNVQE
jgi:hypothetical protein